MRTISFLLQKEFRQIFRHKTILPILFVVPILQLIILPFAADYEIKNIRLEWIDQDQSTYSRQLYSHFQASPFFQIAGTSIHSQEGLESLESGAADLFIVIPADFERDWYREGSSAVQITANAINGTKAGLSTGYAQSILQRFSQEVAAQGGERIPPPFEVTYSHWFNPDLEYDNFMVPGILVLLVTMIGGFLSGMNIVKEKEIGTIEQINVSPIKKHQFILGKLIPFWIIGLFDLALGLGVGKLIFDIPLEGSLGLIFLFGAAYLVLVLGFGLLISTITHTQQQAMFLTWFFLVIFILMSGLFTPIESMPAWAQRLTEFNPIAYFVDVVRMVLLKGSDWSDIQGHFVKIVVFGILINGIATLNYRKTTR
jgi:ABC-2 type transport system permease protein